LNAIGEEAVVGKTSRVVEEVLVGKQSSERTQAIHDSVRKTEVDVEEVPGETTGVGIAKDRY
jgi:stress response protein YsnF